MSEKKAEAPEVVVETRKPANVVGLPNAKKNVQKTSQRQSISERLRKSGLDPQKLLDLTLPMSRRGVSRKTRHMMISIGFVLMVLLPTALVGFYMFFVASNQYHSTTAFAVRSTNSTPATEVLGMVLGGTGGGDSTSSNSYIINDYLQSQAIVENLPDDIDLARIYNPDGADWFFRMGDDLPVEEKLKYWQSMVSVDYDATSGVLYVEVRAFRPEDSQLLAHAILEQSEALVNQLSEKARRQAVKSAEEIVATSEARLKAIQKQILLYRERTQEVSPEQNARLVSELIANLEQQLVEKQAEKLTLLSYLDDDTPKIRILNEHINALESQIQTERKKLGAGTSFDPSDSNNSISFRIADYSDLKLEEEFAQRLYASGLAGLESARRDANSKNLYLATFIKPTLSQESQFPNRKMFTFTMFLFALGVWIVLVLLYYNVRDRS
ncbi:RkpR, polysaccharide export protein [Roseibium sp.]|uniref:RkpR, polysaccharide export protein n=1 Tax=Roseibium sp. TaxID=1936156 RepID=UPI0032648034